MGSVVYGCTKLVIGQLYPAYASFKAVKNRNVKEYVKWMIYWIVFSAYTVVEEMTDLLVYWLPLYYEIKLLILFWLVSPTTRGSSVLYRGLIHPVLLNKEEEIDQYITDAIDKTYSVSVRYARLAAQKITKAMIETAIRGGGGIVTTLKRSVSMNDLSQSEEEEDVYKVRRGHKKQRALMTMSWHEAQTENSSSIFDAETEEEYSSPGQYGQYSHVTRLRRDPRGGSTSHLVDLRTSDLRTSDLRTSELRGSSSSLQSSPMMESRSHTRRQDLGFKPYKAVSSRPSPTMHSAERGRHSSRKLPAPKPPAAAKPNLPKSPSKDEDFSMSYSDAEEKKNCSQM